MATAAPVAPPGFIAEGNPLDPSPPQELPAAAPGATPEYVAEANPLDEGLPPLPPEVPDPQSPLREAVATATGEIPSVLSSMSPATAAIVSAAGTASPAALRVAREAVSGVPDAAASILGQYVEGPVLEGAAGLAGRLYASGADLLGAQHLDPNAESATFRSAVSPYVYAPRTAMGAQALGAADRGAAWLAQPFERPVLQAVHTAESDLGPEGDNLLRTTLGTARDFSGAVPLLGVAAPAADALADTATGVARRLAEPLSNPESPALRYIAPPPTAAPVSAEENLARLSASSPQNMGAAVASPSLLGASPELRDAVSVARSINPVALERQLNADTLPMPEGERPTPLRKGQATRDPIQFTNELEFSKDPALGSQNRLTASIAGQNDTEVKSLNEIRSRAVPDIVQQSNAENAQQVIDAIKSRDNAALTDTRAKYKALADTNGGSMPIDLTAAQDGINAQLAQHWLTSTAQEDPVISEVLAGLKKGKPLSFEQFENARTNLAAVQRKGGPAATAASIVRQGIDNAPLPPEAEGLKALANTARAAAKARYDTVESNPAYKAVVEDDVPRDPVTRLHVVGAQSPLATDGFMDRYFTGHGPAASAGYITRLKGAVSDPSLDSAIEASALNKLHAAAGLDKSDKFANANFLRAAAGLDSKASSLMRPQTLSDLDRLRQYAGDVSFVPPGAAVNWSNTASALERFGAPPPRLAPGLGARMADIGTDIAAEHIAGPTGPWLKRVGTGLWKGSREAREAQQLLAAKEAFARDATAPGAGIDAGAAPVTARAAGGRVDHGALLERLLNRWHAARKSEQHVTKPLLGLPDEAIEKALRVAQATAS